MSEKVAPNQLRLESSARYFDLETPCNHKDATATIACWHCTMAELAHRTPQMPDGKQPVPGAVVRAWGGASCCSVLWLAGDLLQTPSSRRIIEIKNMVLRETYLDG